MHRWKRVIKPVKHRSVKQAWQKKACPCHRCVCTIRCTQLKDIDIWFFVWIPLYLYPQDVRIGYFSTGHSRLFCALSHQPKASRKETDGEVLLSFSLHSAHNFYDLFGLFCLNVIRETVKTVIRPSH